MAQASSRQVPARWKGEFKSYQSWTAHYLQPAYIISLQQKLSTVSKFYTIAKLAL